MGSLWGFSFIVPFVCVFSGKMPFTSVTATASAKRMHDGVTKAAKVVADTTQVARAAYQRRFSAPGGQVKSPLSGVTIAPPPASAPPRTSKPDPRFTYHHGDAYLYTYRRYGLANDAMVADVATTAAEDRLEFEVGHSYWDDHVLGCLCCVLILHCAEVFLIGLCGAAQSSAEQRMLRRQATFVANMAQKFS